MLASNWVCRKREREDTEDEYGESMGEHRVKRLTSSLPQPSPLKSSRSIPPIFSWPKTYGSQPYPSTITPVDSDEDISGIFEQNSFIGETGNPTSSRTTRLSERSSHADDLEMTDSIQSPGDCPNHSSPSFSGRIPTPIHSSFAPFIRAQQTNKWLPNVGGFADDESPFEDSKRGRRLPSPISEGELSPSMIVADFNDMQMEVEGPSPQDFDRATPIKKGHTRSKHSLRAWTPGYGADGPGDVGGMKRSFSMGYRADCEKCRMKVPGHFNHIITY